MLLMNLLLKFILRVGLDCAARQGPRVHFIERETLPSKGAEHISAV